jgi:hypothetical protein
MISFFYSCRWLGLEQPTFAYSHDFDENGLIYWIGTNGRTQSEWANPAKYSIIVVTSSEGRQVCASVSVRPCVCVCGVSSFFFLL